MANRRMIWQELFEDDFFGGQPRDVRLMWIGLIVAVADDQGRFLYNPSIIGAKVFLFDRDIKESEIAKWLIDLVDAGKLILYEQEGKSLLQITKWWDYQSPSWAMPSKFPAPDKWLDRVRRYAGYKQIDTRNWDREGGFAVDQPEVVKEEPKPAPKTNPKTKPKPVKHTEPNGIMNRIIKDYEDKFKQTNHPTLDKLRLCEVADEDEGLLILSTPNKDDVPWLRDRMSAELGHKVSGYKGVQTTVLFEVKG